MRSINEVVRHAAKVKGYMHESELAWLANTARLLPPGSAWCEIGSWQGRSATAVAGGLRPDSRLLLVDNFSGPTTREMPDAAACKRVLEAEIGRMRAFAPGVNVKLAVGPSPAIAAGVLPEAFDVIFIDGDHKYAAVTADIKAWLPALKPGGMLCGHDFTNQCGVEPAVRELLPMFQQVAKTSIWWARP